MGVLQQVVPDRRQEIGEAGIRGAQLTAFGDKQIVKHRKRLVRLVRGEIGANQIVHADQGIGVIGGKVGLEPF